MRLFLPVLLLAMGASAGPSQSAPPGRKVIVVQVIEAIDAANRALVGRAVRRIKEAQPDLVIFEIDTPGGRVDHTLAMGEEMMSLAPIPTVAYVRPLGYAGAAWSAGAYLAMSCKKIYMHPGAVIGAATPIMMTPEGIAPVEEKMVSALREKFRARAEQNGYPANLAVAMVDKDLEIFEVVVDGKKLYLTAGEIEKLKSEGKRFDTPSIPFDSKEKLLTLTDRQVAETGMGKMAESRAVIYQDFGLSSPAEEVIRRSWSENLADFITSGLVRTILLIIGVLGIWLEFKTPGFGVPGIVGILSFALLLFGHHLAGLAEVPEMLLFAAGVVLLAVELFVAPGVGIFAIAGILCVFAGIILSFQDFTIPDPTGAPWQVDVFMNSVGQVILAFVGAAIGFVSILRFLPRVPLLNRLVLQAEIGGTAPAPATQSPELAGRMGHAVTPLRPGGKIEIDGQIHDVVAEGEFIAPGEPVEVLRVEGIRIVVGKVKR